jgi:large subunit ribosomal protein L29|tara:strand:- start:520 stop:702 length:183 start_codon:yes stop_codon:yes gene_type:complete
MNEYKEKTKEELVEELHSLLKERFDLRIQRGSGLSPKPHLFKINKKNIARVKTILVEKNK